MMDSTTADTLVADLVRQLRTLKSSDVVGGAARKSLYEATRDVALTLETRGDSIQRIAYLALQPVGAKIASDLKIFEILAATEGETFDTKKLAEITGANDELLGRILRYLSSVGMIHEVDEDVWGANEISKTLSIPGLKAGIYHHHDNVMPCWQALPDFLAETKYQNPSNPTHSPFQKGHRTAQTTWEWAASVPSRFDYFVQWMAASREGQHIFLDEYPFDKEHCHDSDFQTPLFVDIGGGSGHQCAALKQRFPQIAGRVINLDLPPVIARAIPCKGVEHIAHDFMTEQPVEGARAYYLRNIMHDWPDEKCALILQHIIEAMNDKSVILIDDMVIPNKGATWRQTQLDLTMMAVVAAVERTEKQWYSMLDAAGLKVKQIVRYTPDIRDSLIVAVPK